MSFCVQPSSECHPQSIIVLHVHWRAAYVDPNGILAETDYEVVRECGQKGSLSTR